MFLRCTVKQEKKCPQNIEQDIIVTQPQSTPQSALFELHGTVLTFLNMSGITGVWLSKPCCKKIYSKM